MAAVATRYVPSRAPQHRATLEKLGAVCSSCLQLSTRSLLDDCTIHIASSRLRLRFFTHYSFFIHVVISSFLPTA
jgi:hypothetical protein